MRTIKLVIGYNGERYEGWQSQRNSKTLQELFEKTLSRILKEKTDLISASRTDSGVHALGQTAHFKTKNPLPVARIKSALNFYLPKDVVVFSAKEMPANFHARYQARSKVYHYDIWNSPTRPLFEAPFTLWHPGKLDAASMNRATRHLKGKHDFNAFKAIDGETKSSVREIKRISVKKIKTLIRIEIKGDGFLKHMVRIIAGTLIEVGRKKLKPQAIQQILSSKDRTKAGPTAKPQGLTLLKITY
ncbi:MAG: tRNA pseudouridine(38-40) synthase TruA [Candidatus Omnitrophica bacterium]|nr:tRNA pseudouridine(38-40) synthase TruA [Candidatus Omnitrophota bacterium]